MISDFWRLEYNSCKYEVNNYDNSKSIQVYLGVSWFIQVYVGKSRFIWVDCPWVIKQILAKVTGLGGGGGVRDCMMYVQIQRFELPCKEPLRTLTLWKY